MMQPDSFFVGPQAVAPQVLGFNQYPIPVYCPVYSPTFEYRTEVYNPNMYYYSSMPMYCNPIEAPAAVNSEWVGIESNFYVQNPTEYCEITDADEQHFSQWSLSENWEEKTPVDHITPFENVQPSHLSVQPDYPDNSFRSILYGEVLSFRSVQSQDPQETSGSEYDLSLMASLLPAGLLSPSCSETSDQSLAVPNTLLQEEKEPGKKEVPVMRLNTDDFESKNSHIISNQNQKSTVPPCTADIVQIHQKNSPCISAKPRVSSPRNSSGAQQSKNTVIMDSKMAGRNQLLSDTQTLLSSFKNPTLHDEWRARKPGEWEGAQSIELQEEVSSSASNSRSTTRKPGFRAHENKQYKTKSSRIFYNTSAPCFYPKKHNENPPPLMKDFTPQRSCKEPQEILVTKNNNHWNAGKLSEDISKKDINQREYLEEQLSRGTYECMVCVERVRPHSQTWTCYKCFNIFHLICISKWSYSAFSGSESWRCPTCQDVNYGKPGPYFCFCGKRVKPKVTSFVTPHSCGNVCGRRRFDAPDCTHPCPLRCHPGPCPQCEAYIDRRCPCGKTSIKLRCFMIKNFVCENVCGKLLQCGNHKCTKPCHVRECDACKVEHVQACFCEKSKKTVPCGVEEADFSCENKCGRLLQCGHHYCPSKCHQGSCPPCAFLPATVKNCYCGQTPLSELAVKPRKSCLYPVPHCDKKCNKKLPCGSAEDPHFCQQLCHSAPCPCNKTTRIKCLCGHNSKPISCKDLDEVYRCQKRCNKKKSCFRHKCLNVCCIEDKHLCSIVCNRMLTCGLHKCQQLCHVGKCLPCDNTSFDDLYCRCGASIQMAPISCGTKRPECTQPCNRKHQCSHPPLHNCHDLPECPPCCVLTEKWCYGKHELRKHVPCHQTELSCGLICKAPLPCGLHKCNMVCHKGPCLKETEVCTQPCEKPRMLCGHPCFAPCHVGPCPELPCKTMIRITCPCKHRSAHLFCSENMKEYHIQTSSFLASTMAELQMGHSVDINDKLVGTKAWQRALQGLECNGECKILERNQKMAIALQIKNPDLSQKLSPTYSDFVRNIAKKDESFVDSVHTKLTELVTLAKQSKTKSRSHSFPVMNREKRQFVHEYCAHFGCESIAFDEEPKRNVVVTASKEMSWLPSMSILEVLQREKGHRKVPAPNNREL